MAVATPITRRYQCMAVLSDGYPCGKIFDDDTGAAPCPQCGNADDTSIQAVEVVEEQAPARRPQKQATHPVKGAPLENGKATTKAKAGRGKPSAIVKRETLARSRTGIERLSAWGILFISFAGTVAALHGGWAPLLKAPNVAAIGAGLLIQAALTYVQWAYYHNRPLAWGSRLLDTALTALGYGGLVVAALTQFFVARGVDAEIAGLPGAAVAAWAVISLISYGLAWYPESRLVD